MATVSYGDLTLTVTDETVSYSLRSLTKQYTLKEFASRIYPLVDTEERIKRINHAKEQNEDVT